MRSANAKVGRAHPTPAGRAVAPPGWGCASPAVLDACARGHSGSVVPATAMTAAVADAMTPAMPAVASAVIRISRITAVASRIAAVPTRTADAAAIVARRIGAAGVGGALPCQAAASSGACARRLRTPAIVSVSQMGARNGGVEAQPAAISVDRSNATRVNSLLMTLPPFAADTV